MIGHSQAHDDSNQYSVVTVCVLSSSMCTSWYWSIGKVCILIRSPKITKWAQHSWGGEGREDGEFSHWLGMQLSACLLKYCFTKFGIVIGGFSSEIKKPNYINLVYFEQIMTKCTISAKLSAFLFKMVYCKY